MKQETITTKSPLKYAVVDTNTLIDEKSMQYIRDAGYKIFVPRAVRNEIAYRAKVWKAIKNEKKCPEWTPRIIAQMDGKNGFKIIKTDERKIIMKKVGIYKWINKNGIKKEIQIEMIKKVEIKLIIKVNDKPEESVAIQFLKSCEKMHDFLVAKKIDYPTILSGQKSFILKAKYEHLKKKLETKGTVKIDLKDDPEFNDFRVAASAQTLAENTKNEVVIFSTNRHLQILNEYKKELNLTVSVKEALAEKFKNK